ncbi:IS66 family insertion sequence element accessory protein TnpB [Rhizobium sp. AG207R]|nr:IS66 family insertion sequence element accessory protein TnpB [Rhizobium sp. AG207R]
MPACRLPQRCDIIDGSGQRWWPRPVQRRALCLPVETADRVRIVWWDGSGVCLYSKILEEKGFCRPAATARIRLDHAQLMALLAGLDWKKIRPATNRRPRSTG